MNEAPVFVAEHPWRKRALQAAVATGGALLLAWLVAVVIGALGFGSLPGVPFGSDDDQTKAASEHSAKPAAPAPAAEKHSSSAAAQARGSKGNGSNGSGSGSGSKSASATGGRQGTATTSPTVSTGTIVSSGNAHGANPNAGGANAGGNSATAGGGKPTSTPSGTAPGAYAHGANPNAGGANRSNTTTGKGTTTTG